MSTSLTTVEQFNRGAIQCFLVESVVNLIDLVSYFVSWLLTSVTVGLLNESCK